MKTELRWAYPFVLWLLPLLFAFFWQQYRNSRRRLPAIAFSDVQLVKVAKSIRHRWEGHLPMSLIALAIVLATLALARPQHGLQRRVTTTAGIDIVLCLDTSTSMQAMDLSPNRLQAALEVSQQFVEGRPNDRIGIVVFGGQAITQCPLTTDHGAVQTYLKSIQLGATGVDGTALGNGLATSLNRLKKADGKSRVIILLTDGRNNAGEMDPVAAAKLAKSLGVRVYTIGAATRGQAPVSVRDPLGFDRQVMVRVDLDEELLTKIATETGGKYFRATDTETLAQIFGDINRLEKTEKPRQEVTEYRELYHWWLMPAIFCLFGAMILEATLWRELP